MFFGGVDIDMILIFGAWDCLLIGMVVDCCSLRFGTELDRRRECSSSMIVDAKEVQHGLHAVAECMSGLRKVLDLSFF